MTLTMLDIAATRRLKELNSLVNSIEILSNYQAKIVNCDNIDCVTLVIQPSDGPYAGGTFKFLLDISNYPVRPPRVTCTTPIYHPNIDCYEETDNVCINIINEDWESSINLEAVVQSLLFLFYHPNFEEPLSPLFEPEDLTEIEYLENIRRSLRGEEVEGRDFEKNLRVDLGINCEVENGCVGFTSESTEVVRIAGVSTEMNPVEENDSVIVTRGGKENHLKQNWIKVLRNSIIKLFGRAFKKSTGL